MSFLLAPFKALLGIGPAPYTHSHAPLTSSSHFYCLLLGETGGGKSTVINMLANYFRRGQLDCLKVVIPTQYLPSTEADGAHSENQVEDTTRSQTSLCRTYTFKDQCQPNADAPPATFHFIDTPGLADTRGIDKDSVNVELILTTACRVAFLHSIILVINGSHGRETATIRHVLTQLKGNVPDAVLPTVMIVLTKCSAATSNFDLRLVKELTGANPTVIYMNNSFFTQQPGSVELREYEQDWARSMAAIDGLVTAISTRAHANTRAFKLMVETRSAIKAEMASVLSEINHLGALRQRIDAVQRKHDDADEGKDQYKDYLVQLTVEEWVQIDDDHLNTLCMVHKQICHDGCSLQELEKGAPEFTKCTAFAGSNTCRGCPSDATEACGFAHHYHGKKAWKKETKQVATELEEMKAKYFNCINQAEQASTELSQHEKDLALLRDVLSSKTAAIKGLCVQLKEICRNANLANELYAVTATMQYDAEALQEMDARKEALERIDNFKALAAELSGQKRPPQPQPAVHSVSRHGSSGTKRRNTQHSVKAAPKRARQVTEEDEKEVEDLTSD